MTRGLSRANHSVSLLRDHLVFTPRYRDERLTGEIAEEAESIIREICEDIGIQIIDLAVAPDHVHLYFRYRPGQSLSEIAKRIKGRSARHLRAKFPELKTWCDKGLWMKSNFHGSVGHGSEVVRAYIENQK